MVLPEDAAIGGTENRALETHDAVRMAQRRGLADVEKRHDGIRVNAMRRV